MNDDSYILRLLDECREEIKISDSKASIIFAAVATATALLANLLLDEKQQLRTNGAAVTTLSVVAVATLVSAMVMLGLAVIPRVGRPEAGKARYFEEHAQFESPEALLAVVSADAEVPGVRHAQQLLAMSRIARRKYLHLRRAMLAVALAIGVMALAVLVSAVS
ncbi:MAG: Pycsar system effector family protein [Ilumatobacteraceae bacterium]